MHSSQIFRALLNEANFTIEILGDGATQIRKANYAKKGIYFQSFTSLSTGLERIGKLCLMLDYYIDNDCQFPDSKFLKNEIGHKINVLYDKSVGVKQRRLINHRFMQNLDTEIHQNIINILTNFARGDRYSNIDVLVNSKQHGDPIASWFKEVDMLLYEKHVSQRRKEKIAHNMYSAQLLNKEIGGFFYVQYISETGEAITNIEEMVMHTEIQKAVAVYRQLYVIQVIRFWVELLWALQRTAQSISGEDVPHFSEIFRRFYNEDAYIKTRKAWDRER
jgi:hypothetical protein